MEKSKPTSNRGGKRAGAGRKWIGDGPRCELVQAKVTSRTKLILLELQRINHHESIYGVLCDALESYAEDCVDLGIVTLSTLIAHTEIKKPCDSVG
jgi:hypothetical protein